MTDLLEMVFGAVAFAGGIAAGIMTPLRRKKIQVHACCAGYYSEAWHAMRDDCTALRNPICTDGRCCYHCRAMCKCEDPLGMR